MRASSVVRWAFTDRRTGRITVAHPPNALSIATMVAGVASVVVPGRAGTAARTVRDVAAVGWGLDELLRGVNPWRRALGAATLAVELGRIARR